MNVTTKVYGRFLEGQVYKIKKDGVKIFNGEITVSLKESSSLSELLKVLEISEQTAIMCLINGKIPYFNNKLSDGDKVEIILLVDGGDTGIDPFLGIWGTRRPQVHFLISSRTARTNE